MGFKLTYSPVIRFPASAPVRTVHVRRAARKILRAIPDPIAAARLRRKLRVVRTRAISIGQALHNGPAACREHDRVAPPKCYCHRFPPEWLCASDTSLPTDGHFCILADSYEGPGRKAFTTSHKTPVLASPDDIPRVLYAALRDLWRTLPAPPTATASLDTLDVLISEASTGTTTDLTLTPGPAAVTLRDVRAAERYLRGAVVSAVDKGPGRTVIM